MTRSLAFLMLLTACGGGVCAGCGGDDDAGAIPEHIRVTSEPKDYECDGSASAFSIEVGSADTDHPVFLNAPVGYDTCEPATDNGSSWTIRCNHHAAPTTWYREFTLSKTLDGGTMTSHIDGNVIGDCTVTGAIVRVAVL